MYILQEVYICIYIYMNGFGSRQAVCYPSPLSCVARALFSVVDARSSPSCVAVPGYRCQEIAPSTQHALRMYGWLQRCQEIAPSTQHAPCSYAPGRIVERPLPRDRS